MSSIDQRNKDSLARQRETRTRRDAIKEGKDKLQSALKGATGTRERREIKAAVGNDSRGAIYDISTSSFKLPVANPDTGKRNLADDGIDFVPRNPFTDDSSGGGDDDGFELLDFDVVEGNEAVLYQWRAAAVTP